MLIGPVKVEWLPVTRELNRSCLFSFICNHYKDVGRGHVRYHDLGWDPVCVDEFC